MIVRAHLYVCHADVWPYLAVFTDNGISFQDRSRIQDRIPAYYYRRIYIGICRVDNRNTIGHQFVELAAAQDLFCCRQLLPGIDSQRFFIIRSGKRTDYLSCIHQHADNIRQIVFTLGIIIIYVVQHLPE